MAVGCGDSLPITAAGWKVDNPAVWACRLPSVIHKTTRGTRSSCARCIRYTAADTADRIGTKLVTDGWNNRDGLRKGTPTQKQYQKRCQYRHSKGWGTSNYFHVLDQLRWTPTAAGRLPVIERCLDYEAVNGGFSIALQPNLLSTREDNQVIKHDLRDTSTPSTPVMHGLAESKPFSVIMNA